MFFFCMVFVSFGFLSFLVMVVLRSAGLRGLCCVFGFFVDVSSAWCGFSWWLLPGCVVCVAFSVMAVLRGLVFGDGCAAWFGLR